MTKKYTDHAFKFSLELPEYALVITNTTGSDIVEVKLLKGSNLSATLILSVSERVLNLESYMEKNKLQMKDENHNFNDFNDQHFNIEKMPAHLFEATFDIEDFSFHAACLGVLSGDRAYSIVGVARASSWENIKADVMGVILSFRLF